MNSPFSSLKVTKDNKGLVSVARNQDIKNLDSSVGQSVPGSKVVDAADRRFRGLSFDTQVVTSPMSVVPTAPTPVVSASGNKDSAICQTAVWAATVAGLPPFLSQPAYDLCVSTLPQAKAFLREQGIRGTKALGNYLANTIKSRFMAGNKVTRAPRLAGTQRTGTKMPSVRTPGAASLTAPGPPYGRAIKAAPAAYSVRQRGSGRPRVKSSSRGMIINHSEMIGNLVSNATTLVFSATDFTVNPGKYSTFPWLSTIASNFDKYIMRKVVFHLVSNQPTSTGGKIGIGFDYDSTDPAPSDRNEFFSLTHHVECAPWDSVSLNVPLDNLPRFVNSHTTTDSKLIDCGQVCFMSDQVVATSTALADMIVEYEVELLEPQQAIYSTMVAYGSNVAAFSNLTVVGPVVASMVSTTSTTILEFSLPQGYYLLSFQAYDAGAGSPVIAVTGHNILTSAPYTSSGVGVGSTTQMDYIGKVATTANDCTIKLTFSGVTIDNLEKLTLVITRVSASAYRFPSYATGMATY